MKTQIAIKSNSTLWPVFILLPALLAFVFYNYVLNRNYFMLVEGRSYIAQAIQALDHGGIINWLSQITLHSFITERVTNKFFYVLTSSYCGIGYTCQQVFQILLISFTALVFNIFLKQLKVPLFLSILITIFWAFSHSVLFSVHWQATALEKLLGLFTLSYLVAFFYFLSQPYSRKQSIIANIVLSLILLAALSSKEHSVLLSPISLLFAGVFIIEGSWGFKDSLKRIILPLFFTFFHGLLFLKFIVFPVLLPGTAGVYDGNPLSNFFMFMGFAFNSYENYDLHNSLAVYGIWGSFIILIVIESIECWKLKQKPSRDFLLMVWAGISTLLFMAAMARLHYQNRYYLLVPSFFIYITFFFELKLWAKYIFKLVSRFEAIHKVNFQARFVGLAICCYGLIHLNYFVQFYQSDFAPFAIQSQNFIKSHKVVQEVIVNPLQKKLYFVSEVHGKIASLIHSEFPPGIPRYVGAFWFQDRAYAAGTMVEQVQFVDMKDFNANFKREEDSYYIIFDKELNVAKIDKGYSLLYSQDGQQ